MFESSIDNMCNLEIDTDPSDGKENKRKCFSLSPQLQVYISHFLSSWGDRMWMFAGGLFLIEITPGSLRLVAIFGAALSLTVIFLGAAVGRWVDRTSRLKAAQLSLVTQNVMVCVCTLLLCLLTSYRDQFAFGGNAWLNIILETAVVITACVAQIGTLGSKLCIEKDWIIIISEESDVKLSTMNSVLRTVDLSTEMMAPILVGFVMSSAGMIAGGIVIASWNVVSLLVEYGMLHNLYNKVPSLQRPKVNGTPEENPAKKNIVTTVKDKLKETMATWSLYFEHDTSYAGLGLAFLYMTVLALDNYSRAYVSESGVSKGILGILTACASIFGILGAIAFPFLRKKIGVLRTGIFGFTIESSCLIICVASVFAPGTAFRPYFLFDSSSTSSALSASAFNSTTISPVEYYPKKCSRILADFEDDSDEDSDEHEIEFLEWCLNRQTKNGNISPNENNYTSIILFLTGIITSRFGLWLSDLTVTQILQEEVVEADRGGINGVQSSLNQIFSLLRDVLIIILPTIQTFGYLIILSFMFVVTATALFCVFSHKTRKKATDTS